ncbi:MAG TPA: LuxR C-terminal-related transcriptional regulator [Cyclobacteriaceae bacterium]|nr:LuxR C-terminal-related transcriptional regulator [Cyclobacteriaceae bacterium]
MNGSLDERIKEKVNFINSISDLIPGVIVIHRLPEFVLEYMSETGLKLLGTNWEDIAGLSNEEYVRRFFNKHDADNYVPRLRDLLARNNDETISFFQQVRTSPTTEWDWYMSMIKILMRDDNNRPLLSITIAMKIDPKDKFTAKAARLLKENEFLRTHYHEFAKLTNREKEILRHLALGHSTAQIAKQIHLSSATVETHRKNIKRKIDIRSTYSLSLYARAFDLI